MEIEINKIKIGKRIRKDLGDLTSLKNSIREIGLLHPVVIDEENNLIAGLRRLMVYKSLTREKIPCTKINILEILQGEIDENEERKNFTPSEATEIWESIEKRKGNQYKVERGNLPRSKPREKTSKITGYSPKSLQKAKQIKESGDEELIKEMDKTGKIEPIFNKLKGKKERKKTQEILKQPSENLTDEELFKKHNIPLFLYNIWNVQKKDKRFGDDRFGWMPPEFAFNLLYYFTKQYDEVSDLFAGGCVMEDVCKAMNRTCNSYDLIPRRKSVTLNDITKNIPDISNSQLIFLDPPYWKQAEGEYTKEKTDFGNMDLKVFYDNFFKIFKQLKSKMKKDSYLAFIIQGTQWKNNLILEDHAFKIYRMLEDLNFEFVNRIICPYSTEQYNAQQINKSKKEKIILTLYRDLLVFKNGNSN